MIKVTKARISMKIATSYMYVYVCCMELSSDNFRPTKKEEESCECVRVRAHVFVIRLYARFQSMFPTITYYYFAVIKVGRYQNALKDFCDSCIECLRFSGG